MVMSTRTVTVFFSTIITTVLCSQPPGKNLKAMNDLLVEGGMRATTTTQKEQLEKQNSDVIPLIDQQDAITQWASELAKNPENSNLNYKVGLSYYFSIDQQHLALSYFKKAIRSLTENYDFYNEKEDRAPYSSYYFLADSYLENNSPDSAIKYFALYDEQPGVGKLSTELGLYMSLNAKQSAKNPRNVKVSDFGNVVNSKYAETNPVMRLDNKCLFFSSRRPGGEGSDLNDKDADIYFTLKNSADKWDNVVPFPHNTKYDEAPLYLTPNGDVLYLRRVVKNNSDIYRSEWKNNTWTKPVAVHEINSPFNETGISITADGKELYLCSDQNKVAGRYDFFKFTQEKDGKWGEMHLLTNVINTPYNQVSPYISPDGKTLFFSTNGSSKYGQGGYDIYYSELKDGGSWSAPVSMGFPINKTRDDINYWVSGDDKRYYASLTESASYDIFIVEGGGFDFESIAAGTDVITVTNEMGVTQVMETEKNVEKEVEVTQAVETIVEKEKEVEVIKVVETEKEKEIPLARDADLLDEHLGIKDVRVSDVNVENLTAEERSVLVEKVKSYLVEQLKSNESVKFKVVYFDFNKSNLNLLSLNELKLLVEFLGEHPETKIEIAGHGDNKGSWETNLQLSNKRAHEVYDFLINNKVSPDRMFFYGKGSAVPIVPNDSEENRSKNRRVEVFILK
jgi:outer membrane protein OmpA-like peptidoglycan-associated protein/tetratricopeptide (TPR) repeat protein